MSYSYGSRRATVAPAATSSSSVADVSKDVELSSPPEDSIADLSWSKAANLLAVASWDSKVRIYDITQNSSGTGRAIIDFQGPALACDWSASGHKVVGASTDKTARLLDLGANGAAAQQVAAHDAPIRSVRFFDGPSAAPMIVTGSWDKAVKYWDLRTPTAVGSVTCEDKVYSMDVKKKLLVVATASQQFHVINLDDPMNIFKSVPINQLKKQTRVVSCFPDGTGFAAGTIEGRCALHYVDRDPDDKSNFSFKCHRDAVANNISDCYPVNTMSFHPTYGTLCTGGSDGTMHIWDKDNKNRVKGFAKLGAPVSATAFSHDGKILAYSLSYDWSKGYAYNTPQHVNKVMLHPVLEEEVKPRTGTTRR